MEELKVSTSTERMLPTYLMRNLQALIFDSRLQKKGLFMEVQNAQQKDGFLRERQIAHMIFDNFIVNGTSEALPDFNYLMRVQLKNDTIRSFNTKHDEVLLDLLKRSKFEDISRNSSNNPQD